MPATQCGSCLPDGDGPGKIPRCNQADNTQWPTDRVGECVAGLGGERLAVDAKSLAGIKLQQRDALHDFAFGFFEDFPLLARERARNLVGLLARDVCSTPEYASPLRAWGLLPNSEGRLGGLDGALDICCGGGRKLSDHAIGIGGGVCVGPTLGLSVRT